MSAILLLMGLLVVSSFGSFFMTRRAAPGLPSGVEYAALGFVLGPEALGLVGAENLTAFEPVVQVALGWLAFGAGLDFGLSRERRVPAGRMVFGSAASLLTGAAVAGATGLALVLLRMDWPAHDRLLLVGGIAAVCSESTRHVIASAVDRVPARGSLAEALEDVAHADDLAPLVAVAILFALEPPPNVAVPMALRDWPAITVGMGLALGAGAALLLRTEMSVEDTWAILLGVSLLVIGTAARLGLSTLTASFFMGISVSALSRNGSAVRAMVGPTERPVLLPALVLAGARLDFRASAALPWLAAAAVGARIIMRIVLGWMLAATSRPARRAGPLVGLSWMSSGALAMCIGLAFELRFPGKIGDTVLATAVLSAAAGEMVGPPRLRRALQAAGEIEPSGVVSVPPQRADA